MPTDSLTSPVTRLATCLRNKAGNFDIGFFCTNCSDFEYKRVALELGRGGGGGQRYAMADGRRYGIEVTSNF